jgi:hypothetical protein
MRPARAAEIPRLQLDRVDMKVDCEDFHVDPQDFTQTAPRPMVKRLSEIERHVLRESCRRWPTSFQRSRPDHRAERHPPSGFQQFARSGCSTTPASSGPAVTKRTAAGHRSSSRRRRRSVV